MAEKVPPTHCSCHSRLNWYLISIHNCFKISLFLLSKQSPLCSRSFLSHHILLSTFHFQQSCDFQHFFTHKKKIATLFSGWKFYFLIYSEILSNISPVNLAEKRFVGFIFWRKMSTSYSQYVADLYLLKYHSFTVAWHSFWFSLRSVFCIISCPHLNVMRLSRLAQY